MEYGALACEVAGYWACGGGGAGGGGSRGGGRHCDGHCPPLSCATLLAGSLFSPFPLVVPCSLRRFAGNGLPVLSPLPLPPVPGNVPMGTGPVLTHFGVRTEHKIFMDFIKRKPRKFGVFRLF